MISEFNRSCAPLQHDNRNGSPRMVTVSEDIGGVRQLTLQNYYVLSLTMKLEHAWSLVPFTNIFYEHFLVKKFCTRLMSHNLTIKEKISHVDWSKERLKMFNHGASRREKHNTASSHRSVQTNQICNNQNIALNDHLPYRPVLLRNDKRSD